MATLEDIARHLGVAKSTVSKALNGASDVSQTMRRSVLEAAVELGYTRQRRGEARPKLAVFITNMRYDHPDAFGYDILGGFRKLAEPSGYQVDVIPLERELQLRIRYDEYMMGRNYRGALFLGLCLDDPWLKEFEVCRTPTVLYDNRVSGNPLVTYLGADNREGMELAIRYLRELGHEKIGYLSSALRAFVYQQRLQAFREVLTEAGVPQDQILTRDSYYTNVSINQHFPELRAAGCTAILCSHDTLARHLLNHCSLTGIRVPEDISILGFDDIPMARTTVPPLTTIRQDRTELGKSAFYALSSQMDGVRLSTFLLHTELIQRASAGSPRR